MKHTCSTLFAAAISILGPSAHAVDTNLATAGFTGLGLTPNAKLLAWGEMGLAYDRQLPGAENTSGHNFLLGFGLLPNLEVVGRLATNSIHSNCFTEGCGRRDLSASGKVGIALDRQKRFHIAAGATDVGGSVTFFRSYYGVLTYSEDTLEVSAGLARRQASGGRPARSPLHGVFGSAAWQPLPLVRGHVEYTDGDAWAGVRLFAPAAWLPEGWSAHVGANARLTDSRVTERTWVSAGLTIPLYKVPSLPPARTAQAAPAPLQFAPSAPVAPVTPTLPAPAAPAAAITAPAPALAVPAAPAVPAAALVTDAHLDQLARNLQARGLEDIWVGRMADGSVAVRANNATYNWNVVDALGAALGATADALGDMRALYRVVLTQRQLPIVAVTGQADCLRQWIANPAGTCPGGELTTPGTLSLDVLQDGATWQVRALQPSWKTLRVQLSPVLRTSVGTEVGAFDYSAGVNVGFLQPLWSGATAEWRVQTELAHSDDYAPGELLGRRRVLSGTERLAFTQTVQLRLANWLDEVNDVMVRDRGLAALTAQGTVGRIGHHFDGLHAAVRWEPGQGRHRVTAEAGAFHNAKFGLVPGEPRNAYPLLLSYRYDFSPTRTHLLATGGRFFHNDTGVQLGLRQWFGDVAVQAFVRRTTFSSTGPRTMAGLEMSVPIGPRRDMQPGGFQITGTPRFSHTIDTTIRHPGFNPVVFGHGVLPPAPSIDAIYNSDRASLVYFEDNLERLREAAR